MFIRLEDRYQEATTVARLGDTQQANPTRPGPWGVPP
jgi:hypothetical protein